MEHCSSAFRPGVPGLIPDAWIITPAKAVSAPPVVVVHGITRGMDEMIAGLTPRAQVTGRTLVVPHFSKNHWPRYQLGTCKQRADWALLRLMSALIADGGVMPGRFDLSGFSGGAQFAHRFAWLYPRAMDRLCVTAPGWWTFPDTRTAWPYGMTGASGRDAAQGFRLAANLRPFLDRQIVVCVGSDDVERDGNLRQGTEIDAQQGHTRVDRALRWGEAARACARELGLVPQLSVRMLQGCGHNFTECVTRANLERDFVAPAAASVPMSQGAAPDTSPSPHITLERTAA